MARKSILIFTFSTIILYFILLGLIGEEGYFYARSIKRELRVLRQRQEELVLQVDSLEQQMKLMTSQDALKDAAFRFGYQMEGEQVFYFTEEGDVERLQLTKETSSRTKGQLFKGYAKPWVALFSLAFSSLCTLVWFMVTKRRKRYR